MGGVEHFRFLPLVREEVPRKTWCAVSALIRSLQRSRWLRATYHRRHLTYLEGKPEGEMSMEGMRLNRKVGTAKCRKSCVQEVLKEREAKPGLVEPQFPMVQYYARRSIPDAATPEYTCSTSMWKNTLSGEYPVTNGVRKRTRGLNTLNV
jgi:hypothetical protein